ncbi:MAG: putative glycosyltransferase [Hyphomicrobiales bacterium]|nr:putative glycosyltransferase [Hyphomicrobiales bacterium]
MSMPEAPAQRPLVLLLDARAVGGIERHVTILARGLAERGVDTRIVLLQDYGDTDVVALLTSQGLPFIQLDGTWGALRRALRDMRPRLLHTHGYKAGLMGRVAAKLARIPCVSTFHAGERAAFPVSVYQTLDEWSACLGATIAVSGKIAKSLPFGATLIPNFVDAPPAPTLAPLPKRVSFVGRLSVEKGPDLFCEVARRADPGIAFHAYGDGPMRAELEARYGEHVTFHGVARDMRPVWRDTGLLLMTSRAEGMPMAALEAFSASVPIACSRVGDLPGLVQENANGWTFDVADQDGAERALANWLSAIAQPHEELRTAAWRRAQDFSVAAGLDKLISVYDSAAGLPSTTMLQSSIG